jgi:FMN-dependent NADH-azoreductase
MNAPALLHLDASPRGPRSHSRRLGLDYIVAWRAAHPAGRVLHRDLGANPPPFVTESWVEGAFTPPAGHSPAAQAAIAVSDGYVDELLAATEIVIATPIYNLSIPAVLKAWIDQIVRFGRTFGKSEQGLTGLVRGKKVRVLVASGSDFRPEGAYGPSNFIEPYLRSVLAFIGLTEVEFVYAHSLGNEAQRDSVLAAAQASAQKLAAAA